MPITPRDGLAVVCASLAAVALGAAAFFLLGGGTAPATAGADASPLATSSAATLEGGGPAPAASAGGQLLVDVQGGVEQPGLVRLPPGARVADAISAAGGYSSLADLLAAASAVNLAAPLADGQQVFVPLLGVAGGGQAATGGDTAGGRLVNLNSAAADALDALPGIGPATVEKILAARLEGPFTTLDELVDRKVLNRSQLDGIRDLVTI